MWRSMSIDEFAELEKACGSTVLNVGGVWWRRVRPFLYRPLNPFTSASCEAIRPHLPPLTAVQHAVSHGETANSCLNPLVFDRIADYRIENLRKHHRRYLREAMRNSIELRRIRNADDLTPELHQTYLAFYKRSRYAFHKNRLDRRFFDRWIACHLNQPKAEVLAAVHGGGPVGIYISCLVGDTLFWKTAVNAPAALDLRVPDLILHRYHLEARNQPEIRRIFCGYYTGRSGLDTFKLRRGAAVMALPAHLRMHAWMLRLFQILRPSVYRSLTGLNPEQVRSLTAH